MTTGYLTASAQVTLDATGVGQVQLGPTLHTESWTVTGQSVATSTATKHPQARIYLGTVSPATLVAGTYAGSFDTSSGDQIELASGMFLICRWTGGDPGAVATYVVTGRKVY